MAVERVLVSAEDVFRSSKRDPRLVAAPHTHDADGAGVRILGGARVRPEVVDQTWAE